MGEVGPVGFFFFYFGKIALVPGRELPGQIDKAHLSRMLNPGWKTGINARWQPGLKGSSVLVTGARPRGYRLATAALGRTARTHTEPRC